MSAHVKRVRKLIETGATSWGLVEERADLACVLDEHERMREREEKIRAAWDAMWSRRFDEIEVVEFQRADVEAFREVLAPRTKRSRKPEPAPRGHPDCKPGCSCNSGREWEDPAPRRVRRAAHGFSKRYARKS